MGVSALVGVPATGQGGLAVYGGIFFTPDVGGHGKIAPQSVLFGPDSDALPCGPLFLA